jgi:fibronectin-binding autotransporter adhesin
MRARTEARIFRGILRRQVTKTALLTASALLLDSGPLHANTINWVASVGDITSNSNWQGNVLPGLNDVADINNAGEAQISANEGFTAGEIRVGDTGGSGYGILTQTGGTITATNWMVVGRFANGLYTFSGGTLNKTGGGEFLIAGGNSSQVGVMKMSGSASMVMSNSGVFADGDSEYDNNQGNAQLFMQDAASIDTGGAQFWVGNNIGCTGYLDMTGGTIADSAWISVGRTGGTGTVDISGGSINYTGNNGNHFIVGDSNNGSSIGTGLINQAGGAVNSPNGDFWLGSSGSGTYTIAGGTLTTLALDMAINGGSTGILNLNGGSVSSTAVIHGAGTAAINFNGGVLQALQSNASFLQNFTSSQLNIQPGGAIFDTGGYTNTITSGFSGVGGFTLQGSGGSLTLSASNTYAGDTTINGGTLIIGPSGTLGAGVNVNLSGGSLAISGDSVVANKALNFNGGALQFQNYNSSAISFNNIAYLKLGAGTGAASAFAGLITGSGTLTYVGPGTLNLTNSANTYSGGTLITNGVLQAVPGSLGSGPITVSGTGLLGVSSDASIPGSLVFNGGGISFNNYSSVLNFSPGLNLTLGAATGTASTLTGDITDGPSSATSLTYAGPGILNLRGSNTYTGGTNISAGTLNVTVNSLATGAILLNGGALQYAAGNTTDFTAGPYTLSLGALGGTIDTNTNNVSLAGNISPSTALGAALPGAFQKAGGGTLTLNGNLTTSNVLVQQGTLLLAGTATISTAASPLSNANDFSSIGHLLGDSGTLTLTDSSTFVTAGDLNIADQNGSTGALNIRDNASVQVRTLMVGRQGTASGVVNQTGGTVQEVDNGAGSGDWRIGGGNSSADAAAVGVYNLSGGSFNTGGANLQIGGYGSGTFIQTGGTVFCGVYLSIGRYPGSVGVFNLSSGSGAVYGNTQPVSVVGEQGTGTLLLGGNSTFNTLTLLIGQNDGAVGVVQQTGGVLIAPNGVAFGQNETGNMALPSTSSFNLSGGTLQTSGFSQFASANETGTVNFNGGTLQATQSGASLLSGVSHAYIQSGGLVLNASIGSVTISQSLQHDVTPGAPAVDGGLTLIGGQLTLSGSNSYTGSTILENAVLNISAANAYSNGSSLNISGGSEMVINDHMNGSSYVAVIGSYTNNGQIEINNNAMVIHIGSYKTISNQIAASYNAGAWNGSAGMGGIITSTAAADDTQHLTAIGVATGLTSFQGMPVNTGDILVKYTYYGDANLDGKVDGSDYSRIDNGFLDHLTGWMNGDFNYDGVVDGSDYTLIDNAFNSQGAAVAESVASPTSAIADRGSSPVPEPSTLVLTALAATGMLRRRRR